MAKKPITFPQWIRRYGCTRLGLELGLRGPSTPQKWKSGDRKPGILMAEAVQEIAAKDGVEFSINYLMGGKK